ncbi:MAG TPA: magnesium transporter [bacterium]
MVISRESDTLPTFRELIDKRDFRALKDLLVDLHYADAVMLIEELDLKDRVIVFRVLPKRVAAEAFTYLPFDEQQQLLELFTDRQTAQMFEEMDPDDRADVLEEFPANVVRDLLKRISPEERMMTSQLLGYPENSAGRMMTPEFVDLKAEMSVDEAIEKIRRIGLQKETIYYLYVTSAHRKLKGTVSLRDIISAQPDVKIADIMAPDPVVANTHMDQEEVAAIAVKYDFLAVPVVDNENRLVGIVTIDDLVQVMEEEASEDVYRMAAMEELEDSYFDTSLPVLFRRRILWLILLVFAQAGTGALLKHYQEALTQVIMLVYFVPMLTGSSGNAGTQSAAIMIRGLATGEIEFNQIWRIIGREIAMGVILGLVLGIIGGSMSMILGNDPKLFLAVSIAFLLTIITGNFAGAFLPLLFKRIGFDPAVMSGPFITTIVDFSGVIIYFQIAKMIFNI